MFTFVTLAIVSCSKDDHDDHDHDDHDHDHIAYCLLYTSDAADD